MHNLLKELERIFNDQRDFNRNFFERPEDFDTRSRQTKEYVLYLHGELHDLLRKVKYKVHRNEELLENRPAVLEELTDIFKYLLSLYLVWDVNPTEMLEEYWRKSMVCRQRYSEEFVKSLMKPCVLIDIDNTICDYVNGLLLWIQDNDKDLCQRACLLYDLGERPWLDARTMMVQDQRWQELKHRFRTSGGKRDLPLMPGAKQFMDWVSTLPYNIILLTSRPIDKYPNIYGDTLQWLHGNKIPYDYIWWAHDKRERITGAGLQDNVRFAVDDDHNFIRQLSGLDTQVYYLTQKPASQMLFADNVSIVRSLAEVRIKWEEASRVNR